jgi:hypothetical protein
MSRYIKENYYSTMSLEEKVELQKNIILELEEMVHRTKNVVIDLIEGLYCHETQQHILYSKLVEITNNKVCWEPDVSEDTHIWGNNPSTPQCNNHELRIQQLETTISNMINGNRNGKDINENENETLILKKLKEENHKLFQKSFNISNLTLLINKLTYENETKTDIIMDLKNILESLNPEYKETIKCIIYNIPDKIPNESTKEGDNNEGDNEGDIQVQVFNEGDTYINPDPAIDKDIQNLTHENKRLLLICNEVDELSLKIDKLIHKNEMNDTKIQLLKELLKINHPECLRIYEINEEPNPYI